MSTAGTEEAVWPESVLPPSEFTILVQDDAEPIILSVISSSELVGIAEILPTDVLALPKNAKGVAEIVLTLTKDGKSMGRLQVFMHLSNQMAKIAMPEADEDLEREQEEEEERMQQERQQKWMSRQQLLVRQEDM